MRFAEAGVLLVCAVAIAACDEASIVQPKLLPPLPPPSYSVNHPEPATVKLDKVDTLTGGARDSTIQKAVPYVVIMKVTGSYVATATPNYTYVPAANPSTLYARHGLGITVQSGTNTSNVPFTGTTDGALTMFVTLPRHARISGAYHGGGTNPDMSGKLENGVPWECGSRYQNPCYKYTGIGGSVTMTPLQGTLLLEADSTTVSIGSTVTFTIDSTVVEGHSLGIEVDTAKWVPDAEGKGGEQTEARTVNTCFTGWPLKCALLIRGSGKLEVTAHVNGFRQTQSQHVSVREGAVTLTANKVNVLAGDTVTFTPKWSDGFAIKISQWQFIPDSGTDITGRCGAWLNPCKRSIKQSGKMQVTVERNGQYRTAHAHVGVIPCDSTGDPALDDPNVRKGFGEMMRLSNPDSAPGSGIDSTRVDWWETGWRKERATWVVKRGDGSYYTVQARIDFTTECSIQFDATHHNELRSTLPPGDSIVALAHTHPALPGQRVYGFCSAVDSLGNAKPAQRWPGDNKGVPGYAAVNATQGGGSKSDWDVAAQNLYDVYTMNAAGEIWRLPKGWTYNMRFQNPAKRLKTWKKACGWN